MFEVRKAPEYIERNKAKEALTGWDTDPTDEEIEYTLDKIPAADVAEVNHGEWELYFDGKELMCSVCKATFWDECGNGGTNYCPNCGAKMDGGKNGEL